jgi:erythronate-4-phosphate dehydrogenase
MKIIIDDKIPYIKGAFENLAEVIYLPGSKTTPNVVHDADAIVTRTRTEKKEKLLANSSVKFIATATIGYDHIDTAYCEAAGIRWTNAPGCNSKSVEQYIASVLMVLAEQKNLKLNELCIGVVGAGNVGSKVARFCRILGMKVLINDPPRERVEGVTQFVSLTKIMEEADIITLHVPLNMKGIDATYHLCNEDFFSKLKRNPILINSCRGEVTETASVKNAIKRGLISEFVADCWENEPDIDLELLGLICLATPHIAGYSKDGKAKGTEMSVVALSQYFNLGIDNWKAMDIEPPNNPLIEINGNEMTEQEFISKAILATYDIRNDDFLFRKNPELFEQLRGDYPVRREFPAYEIVAENIDSTTYEILNAFGFKIKFK